MHTRTRTRWQHHLNPSAPPCTNNGKQEHARGKCSLRTRAHISPRRERGARMQAPKQRLAKQKHTRVPRARCTFNSYLQYAVPWRRVRRLPINTDNNNFQLCTCHKRIHAGHKPNIHSTYIFVHGLHYSLNSNCVRLIIWLSVEYTQRWCTTPTHKHSIRSLVASISSKNSLSPL